MAMEGDFSVLSSLLLFCQLLSWALSSFPSSLARRKAGIVVATIVPLTEVCISLPQATLSRGRRTIDPPTLSLSSVGSGARLSEGRLHVVKCHQIHVCSLLGARKHSSPPSGRRAATPLCPVSSPGPISRLSLAPGMQVQPSLPTPCR